MAATMSRETPAPGKGGPLPLTRGRRAALALGVPVCLALVLFTGLSLVADFGEGRYPVSYALPADSGSVAVSLGGGQLVVKPATGDRARLDGTARYSLVRSTLTERSAGGVTRIGYDCPVPFGECGLDATLAVPAAMPVSASTGGGNVTASGLAGRVTLSSGGGDLTADGLSGPLTLDTSGGNIRAAAVTSTAMSASSGGGDIRLADVSAARLTARTSGGNIDGAGIGSPVVSASSGGGDIEIVFTSVPDAVSVDTSGGNITLVLPPGSTTYHVAAVTSGGTVNDTVPQSSSSTHTIDASTGGGDITIRRADA